MFACEKAVARDPENGNYRDSRGLARWRTGNIKGAIEDFQAFVAWDPPYQYCYRSCKDQKSMRQSWIKALRAGKTPITEEEIKILIKETKYYGIYGGKLK